MTYDAAVSSLQPSETRHQTRARDDDGVDRPLGRPDTRYRILHIAGTNGKGSTAAMSAAMLQAAGHRVGLYTSPHLVEFSERIRVDGRMISEADIGRLRRSCRRPPSRTCRQPSLSVRPPWPSSILPRLRLMWRSWKSAWEADLMPPTSSRRSPVPSRRSPWIIKSIWARRCLRSRTKAGIIKPLVPVVVGRMSDEARDDRAGRGGTWRAIEPIGSGVRGGRNAGAVPILGAYASV